MKLYAILSDIHGNHVALKAVEADARAMAQQENIADLQFVCLGDVVDYGPQPRECMDWVREHAIITVQGNHDRAAAAAHHESPLPEVALDLWPITAWTRLQLTMNGNAYQEFIRQHFVHRRAESWPATIPGQPEFVLFHCSLLNDNGRVDMNNVAEKNMEWLADHEQGFKYGFFGHTHHQGLFTKEYGQGWSDKVVSYYTCSEGITGSRYWQPIPLKSDQDWLPLSKYRDHTIFNPGSVGQPRQHQILRTAGVEPDYRAAYMLLRLDERGEGYIQFRRVYYQVDETVDLLKDRVIWPENVEYPLHEREQEIDNASGEPNKERLPVDQRLRHLVDTKLIPTLKNNRA